MTMMMSRKALEDYGLVNLGTIHWNLPPAELVEHALERKEGLLAANGALRATTGAHTGRSPKDKYIVSSEQTASKIWWGENNHPMSPETFAIVRRSLADYLQGRDVYVLDAAAGADPRYRMPIQVITELAWHNLFARNLFLRATEADRLSERPGFTVLCVPHFRLNPRSHGTRSETAIIIDFEERLVLIAGTEYAGEMKKSIFTVLNFILPAEGVLPMHCSANVGAAGDVALFFGLSGTGKTSLSADPERRLIGDDEHGWGDNGIFNFEGGCYAKCINLSREFEPQIWNAVRFGAVYENVVLHEKTREPDYSDASITENTRVAYPVDYIDNVVGSGMAGQPKAVIFLSADSFGVLPPISRLTTEQAMYYFLSGYTSKLAGTERGVTSPQATFSSCFGAAFLPLRPGEYANLLRERIEKYNVRCYLINTGWTGGPYGIGKRININYTRAMVKAAISGAIDEAETMVDPIFGLRIPTSCPDVPSEILNPRNTWIDRDGYDMQATHLAELFKENFKQFTLPSEEVRNAGPR
ncbi:phosphoenolpyruvate carboxykinase (ATP) [Thermosporothrix hazakensis]|jgi:phosphoenolpyruvate carboxykinase (ATP)|uniref:Phosphoenolpyruvate carboxykinase (ATP) n=1 Tax=Thermosporothrix hazakensis TaxID=644383 RepID=A0A326U371_THEHA|nr:phosphoenolpyruvate carboxykinase (ATP) [Thermosporothrix hazakensis]PZW24890.1 phosphoenolpyruvate carboxykinase (ATP) [Thermosporothrix hazakensis]GCE46421.1 phosphoenolpyruvate carboxykinase [ATP] 2 [Thermosporothrix hazakensis]